MNPENSSGKLAKAAFDNINNFYMKKKLTQSSVLPKPASGFWIFAVLVAFFSQASTPVLAQYTFTELLAKGNVCIPMGIDGPLIVGAAGSTGFVSYGSNSMIFPKYPGAVSDLLADISGGIVIGRYQAADSRTHSYTCVIETSTWIPLPKPASNSLEEYVYGIDGSNIVGYYNVASGNPTGFLYDGVNFTFLNTELAPNGVSPTGISGNYIVGAYTDAAYSDHAFIYNITTEIYTTFEHPLGTAGTYPRSISGNYIAGYYMDDSWIDHGFIYNMSNGTSTTVDHPGDGGTRLYGISNGIVVGQYDMAQGFVASPPASPAPAITSFTPTSAGTGTYILITGTNFTDATSVTFGGTAATYTVNSPTSISAQVGVGTTGAVTVVTAGGTATSGETFTYKPSFLTNLANTPGTSSDGSPIWWNGQSFTTGNSMRSLTSVDLSIIIGGADAVVKVYSSASGVIGSAIATLTGTYVSGDIWNFTPAAPLTLTANTTYWLVLYATDFSTFASTDVLTYTGSGTIPETNGIAFSVNSGGSWDYYSGPPLEYFMFALYGDIILPITWDGSESTSWNTAANWSTNAVPTSSDGVTIPDVARDPEVNITNAACSSMTIQSGAVLTIPAGKALTVSGTLTNNSSGGVVIQSDGTGTGSLIMGSAAGAGQATVARYMTTDAWHLVAPPLSGQTISSFLTDNTNIPVKTGVRGMMDYNPAGNVWNSFFTDATAGSLAMGNGYGMRTATSSAVTFTGQPSAGHLTLTGLTSDKWNCVGNPYTSAMAINANTGKASTFLEENAVLNANIDPGFGAIYVWDKADAQNDLEDQYTIINNVSAALYVQQGQAFLIKMNTSATSVVFFDEMQVHDPTLALKSTDNSWERIKLYAKSGNRSGFTQIAFNSGMTRGLDPTYDAGLLKGSTNLAVYTRLVDDNGFPFSIQALPNNGFDTMVIPVGLDFIAGGEVTFSAELQNLSPDCQPILEDKLTHTFTELTTHTYTVTIPANSVVTDRFRLHLSKLSTGLNNEISGNEIRVFAVKNTGIRIIGMVTGNTLATLYDSQGRVIVQRKLVNSDDNIVPTTNLSQGIYLLSLTGGTRPQQFKIQLSE